MFIFLPIWPKRYSKITIHVYMILYHLKTTIHVYIIYIIYIIPNKKVPRYVSCRISHGHQAFFSGAFYTRSTSRGGRPYPTDSDHLSDLWSVAGAFSHGHDVTH